MDSSVSVRILCGIKTKKSKNGDSNKSAPPQESQVGKFISDLICFGREMSFLRKKPALILSSALRIFGCNICFFGLFQYAATFQSRIKCHLLDLPASSQPVLWIMQIRRIDFVISFAPNVSRSLYVVSTLGNFFYMGTLFIDVEWYIRMYSFARMHTPG